MQIRTPENKKKFDNAVRRWANHLQAVLDEPRLQTNEELLAWLQKASAPLENPLPGNYDIYRILRHHPQLFENLYQSKIVRQYLSEMPNITTDISVDEADGSKVFNHRVKNIGAIEQAFYQLQHETAREVAFAYRDDMSKLLTGGGRARTNYPYLSVIGSYVKAHGRTNEGVEPQILTISALKERFTHEAQPLAPLVYEAIHGDMSAGDELDRQYQQRFQLTKEGLMPKHPPELLILPHGYGSKELGRDYNAGHAVCTAYLVDKNSKRILAAILVDSYAPPPGKDAADFTPNEKDSVREHQLAVGLFKKEIEWLQQKQNAPIAFVDASIDIQHELGHCSIHAHESALALAEIAIKQSWAYEDIRRAVKSSDVSGVLPPQKELDTLALQLQGEIWHQMRQMYPNITPEQKPQQLMKGGRWVQRMTDQELQQEHVALKWKMDDLQVQHGYRKILEGKIYPGPKGRNIRSDNEQQKSR